MSSTAQELKHPKGLYVLFTTEMWERFSYYGMRALLVLYLTKKIGMDRENALAIYAMYTSLVYLTPMFGGFVADQLLGQRKTILVGAIVMAMGHFAMAFPPLLHLALGLLIMGNGFFKPNISTLVGGLYPEGDSRKDGAYTIFYMGINLGAFFSPIVCGNLGEKVSWHLGFAAAGVGMVFGLITFWAFSKFLGARGFPPGRKVDENSKLLPSDWMHIVGVSVASLLFVVAAIYSWPFLRSIVWAPTFVAGTGLMIFRGLVIAAVLWAIYFATSFFKKAEHMETNEKLTMEEWQRMAVIGIVTLFSVLFWMGFEQAGGTMTLFADEKTSRTIFGWEFPASLFQSVNPGFIFILAPLFSIFWTKLDQSRFKTPSIAKQGIGLILLGLGFALMAFAQSLAPGAADKVAWIWIVGVYFIHTVAELCLSPIGLSLVNKLAPPRFASQMMAVFLMSSFVGNYLAGTLEALLKTNKDVLAAWLPSMMITGTGDVNLWVFLIATSVGPGVLLLAVTPVLNKWMHGRG